jgi:hypothetical protein
MKWLFSGIIGLLICFSSGMAQQTLSMNSTAQGFSGQIHFGYGQWTSGDLEVDAESGSNFGVKLGYGFTEFIEAFIRYDHGKFIPEYEGFQNFSYNHIDLGARFNLGSTTKPWRPFLQVAATNISTKQEAVDYYGYIVDLDMQGYGISVGAGIKYHFTLAFAALAGADFTFGSMSKIELDGYEYDDTFDANSLRLYLGGTYFF